LTLGLGVAVGYAVQRGDSSSGHRRPSVLGERLTKPAAVIAGPPGTPSPAAALSGAPQPAPATAEPGTAAPRPGSGPGAAQPEAVVVHSFNQATFEFSPDSAQVASTSSYSTTRSAAGSPVTLEVLARAQGSQAALSARITNNSGRQVSFPDGLAVVFTLSRDGGAVESATAAKPGTTILSPGATTEVGTRVPLSSYGSYSVEGTTAYR
jgi:hypothetical protein